MCYWLFQFIAASLAPKFKKCSRLFPLTVFPALFTPADETFWSSALLRSFSFLTKPIRPLSSGGLDQHCLVVCSRRAARFDGSRRRRLECFVGVQEGAAFSRQSRRPSWNRPPDKDFLHMWPISQLEDQVMMFTYENNVVNFLMSSIVASFLSY